MWLRVLMMLVVCVATVAGVSYAQGDADAPAEDIVTITGRVEHLSFEGGFYGIVADDGTQYKPLELDPGFQLEGLRVKVTARIVTKKVFFHGWGTPIEIIRIKKVGRT